MSNKSTLSTSTLSPSSTLSGNVASTNTVSASTTKVSPLTLIVVAVLLFLLVLVWVFRPQASSSVLAAEQPATLQSFQVTVNGETRVVEVSATRSLSQQRPADIRNRDIDRIVSRRGQSYLIMKDGSELRVTPGIKSNLPADVRLRLDYDGPT